MRVASWNVNSLRVREDQVLDWIEDKKPDVLCLQETKVTDQAFPEDGIADLSYDVIYTGQQSYNGVAIISRDEPRDVQRHLPGAPGEEKRFIAATFGALRIVNVYVPNGESLDSEKYAYKLAWLDALCKEIERALETHPSLILMGDFNIAPDAHDVWDGASRTGLFVSEAERSRFRRLLDLGLVDAFREKNGPVTAFSWWDYRGASVRKNQGMRIDHMLVSKALRHRIQDVAIDRPQRTQPEPSDHVPVILDLEEERP